MAKQDRGRGRYRSRYRKAAGWESDSRNRVPQPYYCARQHGLSGAQRARRPTEQSGIDFLDFLDFDPDFDFDFDFDFDSEHDRSDRSDRQPWPGDDALRSARFRTGLETRQGNAGKRPYLHPSLGRSSSLRTSPARCSCLKGLGRKCTSDSRIPCCAMTLAVYPDMNRHCIPG